MNTSSLNDSLCSMAKALADSNYLRVMLALRLAVAILGVVLFIVLFKVQGAKLAIHSSARALLIAHHSWAILQSCANIWAHSFSLVHLAQAHSDPCAYLLTTPVAILVRGPDIFTVYGQVWAFAAMVVERCVATVGYRNYESRRSALGPVLVAIQWLLTILWFYLVVKNLDWSEMKAHSTISSSRNAFMFSNLFWILAGTELLSLAVFYALLYHNKRKRTRIVGEASLTGKYQIDENVRAIRLMIPMILTHFACFMPTLLIFPIYIIAFNPKINPGDHAIFLESVNFIAFYPVLLPIVLFWRHKVLRENMRRATGIYLSNISPVNGKLSDGRTAEQVRHFENLKQYWSNTKRSD